MNDRERWRRSQPQVDDTTREQDAQSDHEKLVRCQVTAIPRLMHWTAWHYDGKPLVRIVGGP